MSGIVELTTRSDISNQDAIDQLELVLERAKAGEVLSVGIAGTMTEGRICYYWGGGKDMATLIGATRMLSRMLEDRLDKD